MALSDWLLKMSGLETIDVDSVAEFIGVDSVCDTTEGIPSTEELEALLLYFVVKRRSFEGKALDVRSKMFIRSIQRDSELLFRKLELGCNWHYIWKIT